MCVRIHESAWAVKCSFLRDGVNSPCGEARVAAAAGMATWPADLDIYCAILEEARAAHVSVILGMGPRHDVPADGGAASLAEPDESANSASV